VEGAEFSAAQAQWPGAQKRLLCHMPRGEKGVLITTFTSSLYAVVRGECLPCRAGALCFSECYCQRIESIVEKRKAAVRQYGRHGAAR